MATLKHIASKNSDYTAIEAYLVYQHDEFSGKVILDKQGRPMLRESYILDTLECGDFSFATACLLANRKYGKNTQCDDIKSHQYIISFDPRDAADNGLTMEKAQALGLNFCKANFPGHPAIVCTHPDGHNHSGNIHVHIVIGSIRTREVERKPYMQKPRDWREGMKHSSTAQTMRHLRVAVTEMCECADLHQINLLEAQGNRVSEREYWARRRGQKRLDQANARLIVAGQKPKQTVYQTELETLRKQIDSVLKKATTFEEFSALLMQEHGVAVKESRGRLSYCPPNRVKFITARKLSKKFEKKQVLAALAQNIRLAPTIQPIATDKPDRIQKLVDIQAKLKQGKSIGYERWAKKHNLKAMAQTLILLQEKGLLNEGALDQRIDELQTQYDSAKEVVLDLETRMADNQKLRSHAAAYKQYRPLTQKRNAVKSPAAFEDQYRAELTAYRAAAAYLKANNITCLPSPNKLEAEYCALASEKAQFYEQYKEAKSELLKLKDAKQNVALFFEEHRTGHHAVDHKRAHQNGSCAVARYAERQHRDHGRAARAVVRGFGSCYALNLAFTEGFRVLGGLLGLVVGDERRQTAAGTRCRADDDADERAEQDRLAAAFVFLLGDLVFGNGSSTDLLVVALRVVLRFHHNLGNCKQTDQCDD